MNDQQPRHVFISYVREDKNLVDKLCIDLQKHGVNVWFDRNDIKAGARWKDAIRAAIRHGDFFIACFSNKYVSKTKTYMNEELTLAIEELRQYASHREWFLPVLLTECNVPAQSIGGGETLLDINWVPLYEDWGSGIKKLLSVIKPVPPRIQKLMNELRTENGMVRNVTADTLGKIGLAAVPYLIEALKDKETGVRRNALYVLGKIGPKSSAAVSALIEAMKDGDKLIRRNAAEALGKIGPVAAQAAPALTEALKFGDTTFRQNVVEALGDIGSESSVAALTEALKDKDTGVRRIAVEALGNIGSEGCVPAIAEALKDKDTYVCRSAVEALGKIGPKSRAAMSALTETLKHYKPEVRDVTAKMLWRIGFAAVPYLIEALNDEDTFACRNAVTVLGKIGPEASVATLKLTEVLNKNDTFVRRNAAIALGKISSEAAMPALTEALKDEDGDVREAAANALRKISHMKCD